ncbi:hypothetical protein CEW89_08425 [Celeribacter ethanolicus]|uniref:DUF3168 domain-containing protein n=1 Tax=Celeribacter ethanolicus TaxID=1758178 RepID=A0A291GBT5_9RHOB|nr:DUF3168 domain-containing protein [Celeribacter ethanolicus]ATG47598.1 hypothetical protein CEW89_08425 [Celeribacter ethanolicus]
MSASFALQKAIVAALRANSGVTSLISDRVYDDVAEADAYPCISLGPSFFSPERQDCFKRRMETVQIDVWDQSQLKKEPCKRICDAVVAALDMANLSLDDPYALGRIDLTLARIMEDPDGHTKHGVLQFECEING